VQYFSCIFFFVIRSFKTCTHWQYQTGHKIEEEQTGGASSNRWGDDKYLRNFSSILEREETDWKASA
jgi:hypothetical protein